MSSQPASASATAPTLPDAVARVARSVVGVVTRRACAAGCVWRDGVVVAPAHAVWRARDTRVVLPDGESVAASVKGLDGGTDIAVLALDAPPAAAAPPALTPGADVDRRVGEFVFAVARDASGMLNASFGHIGAAGGAWRSWRGGRIDRLIRLDRGLYPGFSGAPVADSAGQVLGVATSALSRVHGIVVPVATVDRIVSQLLAHGRVVHGYLGVALQPVRLPEDQAKSLGIAPGAGLLVTSVADGAPAAAAGVMLGDIVVEIGATRVTAIDDVHDALGAAAIGERLRAVLVRGGQRVELSVEVAERPHCG